MLKQALSLELALARRDTGLLLVMALFAITLMASVISGTGADTAETRALQTAANRVQAEWVAQPPKNPHEAAHYGILIYRPRAPLQAIEPGVLPWQGSVTFLEAHKRNLPMLSPASVRNADSRYGGTRFSPLLQLAGGFLALLIGYLVGAREARRGITPLVMGIGARGGAIVSAKALMTFAIVACAAVPAMVVAALSLNGSDAMARFAMLAATSLLHLFTLGGLGVAAGLWLGAARTGLAIVVLAWAMSAVVLPRAADSLAERLAPLTQKGINETILADFAKGPDGHTETEANARFEKATLARYGVTRKEDLPVNFDALLMQADEDHRGAVQDRRNVEADAQRQQQDKIRAAAWLFGPTPAMLDLSARIGSADASAQYRFDAAGEVYRRERTAKLNYHMTENSKTGDWDWKAESLWYAKFPGFSPPQSLLVDDAPGMLPAFAALLGWAGLAALLMGLASRRLDRSVRK